MATTVDIPGLKALSKSVRESPKEINKGIRQRLKVAGRIVVSEIARRTPRATGKLQKATSARVSKGASSVSIVNTAMERSKKYPKGYRYGKRLEFDKKSYKGRYTFFYPGFEAKKDEAIAEIAKVLDDVGRKFAQGG